MTTVVRRSSILGKLEELDLGPFTQGFRVHETDDYFIDVIEMLFNWRVVAAPKSCPLTYDAAYCYIGKDQPTFIAAVLGARVWDGPGTGHPPGWDKYVNTGEWNPEKYS